MSLVCSPLETEHGYHAVIPGIIEDKKIVDTGFG